MTHYVKGDMLIAFKSLLSQHGATKEDYPFFRIKAWHYGTKGYTYTIEGWNVKRRRWVAWGRQFAHYEAEKNFRPMKPAEYVLYGPFPN